MTVCIPFNFSCDCDAWLGGTGGATKKPGARCDACHGTCPSWVHFTTLWGVAARRSTRRGVAVAAPDGLEGVFAEVCAWYAIDVFCMDVVVLVGLYFGVGRMVSRITRAFASRRGEFQRWAYHNNRRKENIMG